VVLVLLLQQIDRLDVVFVLEERVNLLGADQFFDDPEFTVFENGVEDRPLVGDDFQVASVGELQELSAAK